MNATCNASLLQENVSESISDIYGNQAKNLILNIIIQLFAEQIPPISKDNFIQHVDEVWSRIPQDYIHQLYTSIPRGLEAVKRVCIYPSKY